jgi:hypothetical protein
MAMAPCRSQFNLQESTLQRSVRQRDAVQKQLDKSSAMEDQLQEMIVAIKGINYELADEGRVQRRTCVWQGR